jgi:molybdopterin synthase sulfur carrier subunit
MSVLVYVPGVLRDRCGGAAQFPVNAEKLGGVLAEIERRYPDLYKCVCDETGAVRRHVNLFVNVANSRDLDGVDTPLSPGDEVTILPAVSGG